MRTCPECSNPLEDLAVFCDNCGLQLFPEESQAIFSTPQAASGYARRAVGTSPPSKAGVQPGTCSACGFENVPGETFCQNCGVQLAPVASAPPPLPTPIDAKQEPEETSRAKAKCKGCGYFNLIGATFCENCGLALEKDFEIAGDRLPPHLPAGADMQCTFCGYAVHPGERFCDQCGVELTFEAPLSQQGFSSQSDAFDEPVVGMDFQKVTPMEVCPNCGITNPPASVFCDGCGFQFPPDGGPAAARVTHPSDDFQEEQTGVYVTGKLLLFPTGTEIKLPLGKTELLLGRSDPVRGIFPDVDLSDYGGDSGGVSRRHARLSCASTSLFIEDLNSTNFTFLNQQRLEPNQRYAVSDGDEIRLGLMVFQYRST